MSVDHRSVQQIIKNCVPVLVASLFNPVVVVKLIISVNKPHIPPVIRKDQRKSRLLVYFLWSVHRTDEVYNLSNSPQMSPSKKRPRDSDNESCLLYYPDRKSRKCNCGCKINTRFLCYNCENPLREACRHKHQCKTNI